MTNGWQGLALAALAVGLFALSDGSAEAVSGSDCLNAELKCRENCDKTRSDPSICYQVCDAKWETCNECAVRPDIHSAEFCKNAGLPLLRPKLPPALKNGGTLPQQ